MAKLQDTMNQAKRVYDAKQQGAREEARYEAGTRALPYDKKRMDVVRAAMAKHKALSPEELEKLDAQFESLRADDTPSEYAKRKGRAQAMEATDG